MKEWELRIKHRHHLFDITHWTNGTITNAAISNILYPGDQLVNLASGQRMWVVETQLNGIGVPEKSGLG